jgi:hypothetical protein
LRSCLHHPHHVQHLAWIAVTEVWHAQVDLGGLDRGHRHQLGVNRDPDDAEGRRRSLDRLLRHVSFDLGKEAGRVKAREAVRRQRLQGAGTGPAWL